MNRSIAILSLVLAGSLAACAQVEPYQRSAEYQPLPGGYYLGSGTAAGWGDFYSEGFGYDNWVSDPGPAGAGRR